MSQLQEPIKLIWCGDFTPTERDWVRFLLSEVPSEDVFLQDVNDIPVAPRTLYVIMTVTHPIEFWPAEFLEAARRTPGVGLFHLGDEWFEGDYNAYRCFDYVLRTYYSRRFRQAGIRVVPLGWPNDTRSCGKLAAERRYMWSFIGGLVGSRPEMISGLARVEPNFQHVYGSGGAAEALSKDRYVDILQESAFSPAPMGNVHMETWRLYEALEAGSIPIVERRRLNDYYADLLGEHPIPVVRRWPEAAALMTRLASDPDALNRLQADIGAWWSAAKARLTTDVAAFVADGVEGRFSASLAAWSFDTGVRRALWQYAELMRHGTMSSLRRRLWLFMGRLATRQPMVVHTDRGRRAKAAA